MSCNKTVVFCNEESCSGEAMEFSEKIGARYITDKSLITDDLLTVQFSGNGISLINNGITVHGDFAKNMNRLKIGNLRSEMLIKAVKIKGRENLNIIDATAGMGEDSLLLAAFGYSVTLYELDPIVFLLLNDTVKRAKSVPELCNIVNNMDLVNGDSITGMKNLSYKPDVILLDPMFPERTKSALVKKKFQIIHNLQKPCDNENELFCAAVDAKPRKIVVKRPAKGEYLAGKKPDYSHSGKAIRYDCYIIRGE